MASSNESVARITDRLLKLDGEILPMLRTLFAERVNECEYTREEYVAVKSVMGDAVGEEVLEKIRTSVHEVAEIEEEIMQAHARLDELYSELQDIDNFIITLSSRDMPVLVSGVEMPFMEAVVKLIMTDLSTMMGLDNQADIAESEKAMQEINLTHDALERVRLQLDALVGAITLMENSIYTKENLLNDIISRFTRVKPDADAGTTEATAEELKRDLSELEKTEQEILDKLSALDKEAKATHARTQEAIIAEMHAASLTEFISWLEQNVGLLPSEGSELDQAVFYEALKVEADNFANANSQGKFRIVLDETGKISLATAKLKVKEKSDLDAKELILYEQAVASALSSLLLKMCASSISPILKVAVA
jgi:predicted  nucleic acid-binding Zn-ribbon protein